MTQQTKSDNLYLLTTVLLCVAVVSLAAYTIRNEVDQQVSQDRILEKVNRFDDRVDRVATDLDAAQTDITTIWNKLKLAQKDRARYADNPKLYEEETTREKEEKEVKAVEEKIGVLEMEKDAIRKKYHPNDE